MLDLFFPRRCPVCGQIVADGVVICSECLQALQRTEQSYLRDNMTEALFRDIPKFVRGAVFFYFEHEDSVHRVLHQMKYGRFADPLIGYVLAKEAACDFMQSDFFDGIDVFIPVPLHPIRLRERGFNQSEWICKALSEITGIPTDTTHLRRAKYNSHQALMKKAEREANVDHIFALNHPEELYHKHIMLVDDIITTGATLRSCMQTLKSLRGSRISVFGLGKVR
ncbi:MAG: ComF family protein [Paludibacteraceae bacterium]|nr:ComF family protein [Paludibacteraceae bacterium]